MTVVGSALGVIFANDAIAFLFAIAVPLPPFVIPAKAGTQFYGCCWVPAFAGMTKCEVGNPAFAAPFQPFATLNPCPLGGLGP